MRPDIATSGRLMTEDEFLALPVTKTKTELLDGELLREPSPGFGHQHEVGCVFLALSTWAATQAPRPDVCVSPLDVRFAPGRILQPDALVFLQPLARPVRMPIDRIPDLCVEMVSTRRSYDRVTKRLAYGEAGVAEYWAVIPELGFLERFHGPGLRLREELRDHLTTPLLPGFELNVKTLLLAGS